jgi:hypothetical protein
MVSEILMGFDESTLAYDLQRAHSADIWFLRARFWLWGGIACVCSFALGHLLPLFGINLFQWMLDGMFSMWHHLWS